VSASEDDAGAAAATAAAAAADILSLQLCSTDRASKAADAAASISATKMLQFITTRMRIARTTVPAAAELAAKFEGQPEYPARSLSMLRRTERSRGGKRGMPAAGESKKLEVVKGRGEKGGGGGAPL
jgi:hypothetical protein